MTDQEKDNGGSGDNFVKMEWNTLDLVTYNGVTVTAAMKIILSIIYSYEKHGKSYYESADKIGKRCGTTEKTARTTLKKMETAGMITITPVSGSTNKLTSKPLNPELMVSINDSKQIKPVKLKEQPPQPLQELQPSQDLQTPQHFQVEASEGQTPNDVDSNDDSNSGSGDNASGCDDMAEKLEAVPLWEGENFINGRLSENAYQWALSVGVARNDWRHAFLLVWETLGVTPLPPVAEIEDFRKPLSLC